MAVELTRPTAADTVVLGDICYRAFKHISDKHGFPTDFGNPDFARLVVASCVASESGYAVAASQDGDLAGSNFSSFTDEVAGVVPVAVDPDKAGRGHRPPADGAAYAANPYHICKDLREDGSQEV